MGRFIKIILVVIVLTGILVLVINNYSWVFSKTVSGEIVDVERVTDPTAILSSRASAEQMYSYSILIHGDDGHLYTASSEDRQWQVVKKGYCVEAVLFRYPPWHLDKANTFFNARLKDVRMCPGQTKLPENTPVPTGPGDSNKAPPPSQPGY